MKFRNVLKAIVITGPRDSVPPFGVTRNYLDRELDDIIELRAAIEKGYLVPFEGPDPKLVKEIDTRTENEPRWQSSPDTSAGTLVKKSTPGGEVHYIVADAEGVDGVPSGDPTVLTSLPEGARSSDYIEQGLDAGKLTLETQRASGTLTAAVAATAKPKAAADYTNAADAYEAALNDESDAADFDDEDTLAEREQERSPVTDVDQDIAEDYSQVLKQNGADGSDPVSVRAIVEDGAAKALEGLRSAATPNPSDREFVSKAGVSDRVVDFLKQPFTAKKWSISKESDHLFLSEVSKHSQSDNVQALIRQRLSELKKA
jgi:hypothetical protein